MVRGRAEYLLGKTAAGSTHASGPAVEGDGEERWSKNRRCELSFEEARAQGGG